jgi:hypothetical protein
LGLNFLDRIAHALTQVTPEQFDAANANLAADNYGAPTLNFLRQPTGISAPVDDTGIPDSSPASQPQPNFLPPMYLAGSAKGLNFLPGNNSDQLTPPGAVQDLAAQPPEVQAPDMTGGGIQPNFISNNAKLPELKAPSFAEASANPSGGGLTKGGMLLNILRAGLSGAGAGAGSYSFGEGFARGSGQEQKRQQLALQQKQIQFENQRQKQADQRAQQAADIQAAQAPVDLQLKNQQYEAGQRALAVKNPTPEELLAQRTKEADTLGLKGDVRTSYLAVGKLPEDFGKQVKADTEFEAWQKQNPGAPVGDYLKLAHPKQYAPPTEKPHFQPIYDNKGQLLSFFDPETGKTVQPPSGGASTKPGGDRANTDRQKRGDLANNAIDNLNSMEEIINRRPDLIGPGAGRFTSVQQMMGSNDPDISALGMAAHNAALASNGAHGLRSAQAIEGTEAALLNHFKSGPEGIKGGIRQLRSSLGTFVRDANLGTKPSASGEMTPQIGDTVTVGGKKVKITSLHSDGSFDAEPAK